MQVTSVANSVIELSWILDVKVLLGAENSITFNMIYIGKVQKIVNYIVWNRVKFTRAGIMEWRAAQPRMKLTGLIARRVRGRICQLWLWFKDGLGPTRPVILYNRWAAKFISGG